MSRRSSSDVLELFSQKTWMKVCAPMVRYSKLQFRNLVKRYDCDLVFTPMILADSFCKSAKARDSEFTTNLFDTPLITQFAANTVHDFVGASYMVAPFCDGVDLNCGCPQRWAREMNLGCSLLKSPQKIFELVKECRNRISKPFTISVKLRIGENIQETIKVCQGLEHCGVSFITVHSRTPCNNTGPINEDALKILSQTVKVPLIGNGGVNSLDDAVGLQERTGVKGVMVANAILTNPAIFKGEKVTTRQCVQDWLDICYNSTLTMEEHERTVAKDEANQCYAISEKPSSLTFQCFHHHLVFMLEKILNKKERQVFNNLKQFSTVQEFLAQHLGIRPKLFGREHFVQSLPLNIHTESRDFLYNELKPPEESVCTEYDFLYDSSKSNGKFFEGKLTDEINEDCDWTDMFYEND
ncbi:hypothetical protein HUJ04_006518 [Dendroctonus ponderosae]|uniref:DUS-like FMN-binding domain-containing protein n=1 Tax=Dendroctonus ponderosae TaxID=77166 RepID=A0AAR5PQA2_DENPD|nr:hypothetical protein HUJ04_006518 [Dendroctonus ponderosae]